MEAASAFRIATLEPADVVTHDGFSEVVWDAHASGRPRQRESDVGAKDSEKQASILALVLTDFAPQKPDVRGVRGSINDLK